MMFMAIATIWHLPWLIPIFAAVLAAGLGVPVS